MREKMQQWKDLQLKINALLEEQKVMADEIRAFVLENKATLEGDGVKATYSKGRGSYDYQSAGENAPTEVIEKHTVPKTDWRKVCKDAGIQGGELQPFYKAGNPSVSIKLI